MKMDKHSLAQSLLKERLLRLETGSPELQSKLFKEVDDYLDGSDEPDQAFSPQFIDDLVTLFDELHQKGLTIYEGTLGTAKAVVKVLTPYLFDTDVPVVEVSEFFITLRWDTPEDIISLNITSDYVILSHKDGIEQLSPESWVDVLPLLGGGLLN